MTEDELDRATALEVRRLYPEWDRGLRDTFDRKIRAQRWARVRADLQEGRHDPT